MCVCIHLATARINRPQAVERILAAREHVQGVTSEIDDSRQTVIVRRGGWLVARIDFVVDDASDDALAPMHRGGRRARRRAG